MNIIMGGHKIIGFLRFYFNPVKYARSLGMNVGEQTTIMTWRFGSEPWLISIGNHVKITSNVRFITHDGGSWVFRDQERYQNVKKFGKIEIKDNCFIGNNVIIMPGVSIGPNAVVGAGAVVTKDVPAGTVVVGVPAKVIMTVEEYAEKSLVDTPPYDMERYKHDRKSEILRFIK
jgi:acetyltransferase-like isoleucine patch superfamily enzyme